MTGMYVRITKNPYEGLDGRMFKVGCILTVILYIISAYFYTVDNSNFTNIAFRIILLFNILMLPLLSLYFINKGFAFPKGISECNFFIYCIHGVIVAIIAKMSPVLHVPTVAVDKIQFVVMLMNTIIVILLCAIIYRYLRRLRWFRFILGDR